jgi:hypothetical protein
MQGGGGTGDSGAHGQQGQRHLGWRRGRGHGRDGGKVLAAVAAFVALNGQLGSRSRVCGSQRLNSTAGLA